MLALLERRPGDALGRFHAPRPGSHALRHRAVSHGIDPSGIPYKKIVPMIRLRVFNAHPTHRPRAKEVAALGRAMLRTEGFAKADCAIVFIGDRRMVSLNTRYLRHRYPTGVLPFSLGEAQGELAGEVYVNVDQARRQAKTYGATFRAEIARLALHGLLHLAGYDD